MNESGKPLNSSEPRRNPPGAASGKPTSSLDLSGLKRLVQEIEAVAADRLTRNPLQSLTAIVAGGAAVYYLAERGKNPKVNHYWDALEYVATCASVGYSNIFPETPVGKMVASLLFLVGPSLAAKALDGPRVAEPANESNNRLDAVVARLDAILSQLRQNADLPLWPPTVSQDCK